MTEAQVRQTLGTPTWVGGSGCIGVGGKEVIRWDYRRSFLGHCVHHYVDFDYIGAGGAPVVYRLERFSEEWRWPAWFPLQPTRGIARKYFLPSEVRTRSAANGQPR
jgi:hypothetical protein